jgi:hypothetical protein
LLATDAVLISTLVDGVVIFVDAVATPREQVKAAYDRLEYGTRTSWRRAEQNDSFGKTFLALSDDYSRPFGWAAWFWILDASERRGLLANLRIRTARQGLAI